MLNTDYPKKGKLNKDDVLIVETQDERYTITGEELAKSIYDILVDDDLITPPKPDPEPDDQ